KILGRAFSSSPHDEGVGRGPRRGAMQKRSSSPRPSPPSDGGEGVVAASPCCARANCNWPRHSPALLIMPTPMKIHFHLLAVCALGLALSPAPLRASDAR